MTHLAELLVVESFCVQYSNTCFPSFFPLVLEEGATHMSFIRLLLSNSYVFAEVINWNAKLTFGKECHPFRSTFQKCRCANKSFWSCEKMEDGYICTLLGWGSPPHDLHSFDNNGIQS